MLSRVGEGAAGVMLTRVGAAWARFALPTLPHVTP